MNAAEEIDLLRAVLRLTHDIFTLQFQTIVWNRLTPEQIEAVDRALTEGGRMSDDEATAILRCRDCGHRLQQLPEGSWRHDDDWQERDHEARPDNGSEGPAA